MITSSMRSLIVHMLLTIGAMLAMLLIAWMALRLPANHLDWLAPRRATAAYFAWWRTLLYDLHRLGSSVAHTASSFGPAKTKASGIDRFQLDHPGRTVSRVRCSHEHEHQQLP